MINVDIKLQLNSSHEKEKNENLTTLNVFAIRRKVSCFEIPSVEPNNYTSMKPKESANFEEFQWLAKAYDREGRKLIIELNEGEMINKIAHEIYLVVG